MGTSKIYGRKAEDVAKRCKAMRNTYHSIYGRQTTFQEIADVFGVNHTTVMYHVNRRCKCVYKEIDEDK